MHGSDEMIKTIVHTCVKLSRGRRLKRKTVRVGGNCADFCDSSWCWLTFIQLSCITVVRIAVEFLAATEEEWRPWTWPLFTLLTTKQGTFTAGQLGHYGWHWVRKFEVPWWSTSRLPGTIKCNVQGRTYPDRLHYLPGVRDGEQRWLDHWTQHILSSLWLH